MPKRDVSSSGASSDRIEVLLANKPSAAEAHGWVQRPDQNPHVTVSGGIFRIFQFSEFGAFLTDLVDFRWHHWIVGLTSLV